MCCPYLTAPKSINLFFTPPQIFSCLRDISTLMSPCPPMLQAGTQLLAFPLRLMPCASPCLSPGLRLVLRCLGFLSFSLPMSHRFLETCTAYCQVPQTCSFHSPSLAEPLKLPLLQPLCATSKMHTF